MSSDAFSSQGEKSTILKNCVPNNDGFSIFSPNCPRVSTVDTEYPSVKLYLYTKSILTFQGQKWHLQMSYSVYPEV